MAIELFVIIRIYYFCDREKILKKNIKDNVFIFARYCGKFWGNFEICVLKNLLIKDEGMRLIVLSCIYAFSFIVLIVGEGESYRIVIVSRACVASMRPS